MLGDDISTALLELRAQAESMMRDTCRVTSSAAGAWDAATGTYGAPTLTTIYEGKCRVRRPAAAPQVTSSGETAWAVDTYVVSLPVVGSEGVQDGHEVQILTAANDAALVGLTLSVTGGHWQTDSTARRLPCKVVTRDE